MLLTFINGVPTALSAEDEAVQRRVWAAAHQKGLAAGILAQLAQLDAQQTPRRQRDAIAGTDNGWMAAQEAVAVILRQYL